MAIIIDNTKAVEQKNTVNNNENAKIEILLTKASFFSRAKTFLMFVYLVFNKLILLRCPGNDTMEAR